MKSIPENWARTLRLLAGIQVTQSLPHAQKLAMELEEELGKLVAGVPIPTKEPVKPSVFLGGTLDGNTWRREMMGYLGEKGLAWFNPIVEDWTAEAQRQEVEARDECDFLLYVITPQMSGFYSIAEVVEDSIKRPNQTVLVVLEGYADSFTEGQIRSLRSVEAMVKKNGGHVVDSLKDAADWMKSKATPPIQKEVRSRLYAWLATNPTAKKEIEGIYWVLFDAYPMGKAGDSHDTVREYDIADTLREIAHKLATGALTETQAHQIEQVLQDHKLA